MRFERNVIEEAVTLRQALERLNGLSGSEMTLFVVDSLSSRRVVGTLTNGDARRALLRGVGLDDPVSLAMYRDFRSLKTTETDQVDEIRELRCAGILMVPVVDASGVLVNVADLNAQPTRLPLSAILMAGGKGERLRPLTLDVPKPLLEVEGKAIIDYNIEALARAGIDDITVCARYMAEKIASHFANAVAGVKVKCVVEDKALGTLGGVTLAEIPSHGATLVMNSDLLTTVSLEDMYVKHRDTGAMVTVGVIPYQVSVPYAILSTQGDSVTAIEEKPSYSYYANAGIYIFNNEVLRALKPEERADAPDVIRDVISHGGKVSYYVINGTWIDIGSPTDFHQAQELMRHHRNLSKNT